VYDDTVKKHFAVHYKSGNKASIKKLERIVKELSETPFLGTGDPHALGYELSGSWSRHINKKDVLIYTVFEEIKIVQIHSALGHYQDK
jgi:toxin YoeB